MVIVKVSSTLLSQLPGGGQYQQHNGRVTLLNTPTNQG